MLSENESNVPKLFPSEQLSGTATKHKDMNTLKVNSRTNHIYCFARLWWRLDVSVKTKLSMKMWNMTFEATYHTTMWGKFIYILRDSFVYSHEFASPSFNEWIFFLFFFFFCWPTAKLFSVFENEKCLLHCTPPTIWGMASTHDPVLVTSYIPLDGEVPWWLNICHIRWTARLWWAVVRATYFQHVSIPSSSRIDDLSRLFVSTKCTLNGQSHNFRQGNQFENQTTVLIFEAFLTEAEEHQD